MFNWLINLFGDAAYDSAIYSADLASNAGMHQMKEPENLQEIAMEAKKEDE
ncbi:MAG: hypothetical protein IJB70_03920 [Clostridia bacterium]|nr:hypothetical protein [Clostridia bacterium]